MTTVVLAGCSKQGGSSGGNNAATSSKSAKKRGGANLGNFPAEYPIAYLGLITREHSVQDFYGPDTVFATEFQGNPCRVIIESSSGNGSEFTATILLKAQNSSGKEVDALRLEAAFRANAVNEVSNLRYVKLDSLVAGRSAERSSTGDPTDEGEVVGLFGGIIDTFWGSDTVPKEIQGTWVRKGADSGRDFDSTMINTADKVEWQYSDGRSFMAAMNNVTAETNFNADTKGEYPSGWRISYTVTESNDSSSEVGERYNTFWCFNAKKNKCNQNGKDLIDIFVKQ
jgi:hypothetical protein